jgi:hypothetical protein
MSDSDPIAERLYDALMAAQREAGDDALVQALDLLAARTGQNTIRHAAAIIRGKAVGRKAIDDRGSLKRITAYPPPRRHTAASIEARRIAGAEASKTRVKTIANRLRKKLRENKKGGNAYPPRDRPIEVKA